MLWTCQHPGCGCLGIAATLTKCPMCQKERDMPKATSAGASNADAGPGEPGYIPPEPPQEPAAGPAEVAEPQEEAPQDSGPALQDHPGYGTEMVGVEHPADGTESPPVSNDPEPVSPPPASAPKAEWVDHVAQVAGVEPDEAAQMTKPQLQALAAEAAAAPDQGLTSQVTITADAEVTRAEPGQ